MNKRKLILVFIFSVSIHNISAQYSNFDFAVNPGTFGWGMNIPRDSTHGHFTFNFLNIFAEHKNSGIGIGISPFNSWVSNENFFISFLNVKLYYNFFGFYDNLSRRWGSSNFFLIAPFVSLNYLSLGHNHQIDPRNVQFNIGFRIMGMLDYTEVWDSYFLPPFGFQYINLELGYRFNNNGLRRHQFYFNISTDIVVLVYLLWIGIMASSGSE